MAESKISNTMSKKGQVTIFVIVAIVIVGLIALFFMVRENKGELSVDTQKESGAQQFISVCTSEAVKNVVEKIIPQGGFLEPKNYKIYNDTKATYLCENRGYYKPCINQHPMLINEISDEIKTNITPAIENCFATMKSQFEKSGYSVSFENLTLGVSLAPDRIFTEVNRKTTISKNEEARLFENVRIETISPLYDLANIAAAIAQDEAKYCYFEYVDYMMIYPRYLITLDTMSDQTKIYKIKEKNSNNEMNIAIRGCALPHGFI